MRGVAAVALRVAPLRPPVPPRRRRSPSGSSGSSTSRATGRSRDEVLASAIATTNSSWFARAFLFRWLGPGREALLRRAGVPARRGPPRGALPPERLSRTSQIDTVGPADARRTSTSPSGSREGEPIRVTTLDHHRARHRSPATLRRETLRGPAAPAGRPVQPLRHAGHRRHASPAGSRTAAIPSARVFTSFETNRDAETATVTLDVGAGKRRGDRHGAAWSAPSRIDPPLVAQPAGRPAGTALLPGRAVPEPAQPLRLRPVPLRHRQHRLRRVPAGRRLGAARGAGEREPGAGGSAAASATAPTTASAARWAGPRATSWGAAAASSTSPAGSPRSAWASRSTGGSTDSICSSSQEDSVGSAKVNFNLGASIRRPAFLSPNNTITVSLFTERRSEFKVYLRQETGTTRHAAPRDARGGGSRCR